MIAHHRVAVHRCYESLRVLESFVNVIHPLCVSGTGSTAATCGLVNITGNNVLDGDPDGLGEEQF